MMVKPSLITKKTRHFSVRIETKLFAYLPEDGKSEYINNALRTYQNSGELNEHEIQALREQNRELHDQNIELQEENDQAKNELLKFFTLFQNNAANLDITEEQRNYYINLWGKLNEQAK